ncbi:MAG TPA: DMT family transporter [Casimicrobiaceae bacterium]|nr:DMT family transporter [Casimicrobiaceae bacterium]
MPGHSFRWAALAPPLFVVLWSTGFIASKLGVPYIEPFTFLSLRFAFVLLLMLPLAVVLRAKWPATAREAAHIGVAGALIQGGYLGGCFSAVFHGMPAGVTALVVGLQPVVTAFAAAPFLKERVTALQWLGLALGFGGVVMVMWQKTSLEGLTPISMAWAVLALVSITAGTVYQKRYCPAFDLRTGSVIQFGVALALLLPLAGFTETMRVAWTVDLVVALAWLVLVLSIGAISVLFYLIKRGEATRVASLFYLTPITTAAMAYFIFGETLDATALAGMVIGIIGVALIVRRPELATPEP